MWFGGFVLLRVFKPKKMTVFILCLLQEALVLLSIEVDSTVTSLAGTKRTSGKAPWL